MIDNQSKDAIAKQCSNFEPGALEEILSHLSSDFKLFCRPEEMADYLNLSQDLKPDLPLRLRLRQEGAETYKIVVIAYDYFSEFSILCGLISSFGFNIEAGYVQTLALAKGRKKIIDILRVRLMGAATFDSAAQVLFEEELFALIGRLEKGEFREARKAINHRLVKNLSRMQGEMSPGPGPLGGLLSPIEIRFDNRESEEWTILSIRGQDTPAFLYAFSNALAMRNIYIHKIKIDQEGSAIHNRLFISNRRGRKITGASEQKALKISVVLIKQFVHYLAIAPDPMMAMKHFDQFLDKILEMEDSRPLIAFLKKKETLALLARFFGSSGFLWEDFLRIRFDAFFPILEDLKRKPIRTGKKTMARTLQRRLHSVVDLEAAKKVLNDYKDEEMFRIDMRHFHEAHFDLIPFSKALSDLAEVVVETAYKTCDDHLASRYGRPSRQKENGSTVSFSICAFGKFGGRELGYASDIELIFIYESDGLTIGPEIIENKIYFEQLAKQIIDFIAARQEGIFAIDTRLRPYGKSGPLAVSLEQFSHYYSPEGKAAPFERQALIKLRAVAGSPSLGMRCEEIRDAFVYGEQAWNREDALLLRTMQMQELVPEGKVNVKYSAGGLIDIEYLCQYLQIRHGKDQPSIRTPNTLKALRALEQAGVLDANALDANAIEELEAAYRFFRALIDALRIVRGNAKDLLIPETESEEFVFLSRRMGYGKRNWQKGSNRLATEIQQHMSTTHRHFKALFPLVLASFSRVEA